LNDQSKSAEGGEGRKVEKRGGRKAILLKPPQENLRERKRGKEKKKKKKKKTFPLPRVDGKSQKRCRSNHQIISTEPLFFSLSHFLH